jgi:glycosyltransferase involved in cell wall biosynthesis
LPVRIAVLSPPWIPSPPRGYGGIEWVVHLLTEELIRRGHEVTLFATGDSHSSADLRWVHEVAPTAQMHQTMPDALHAGAAFRRIIAEGKAGRAYDVVHDHTAWLGVAFAATIEPPVVHTIHGPFVEQNRAFYERFRDDASFVAISRYQQRDFPGLAYAACVPNAVDVSSFEFRDAKDDYLLSLGRIARDKAQGIAVSVAKQVEIPLVLAGKIDPGEDTAYFEEAVLPFVDGDLIRFEGEVPDERKRELLAGARALLFPIQWPEPFGLVMIEAMACGTPVIATPHGAVPEVVTHGETGLVVESEQEMVEAVKRISEISPARCRAEAERRFSPQVMTDAYERVYAAVAGR